MNLCKDKATLRNAIVVFVAIMTYFTFYSCNGKVISSKKTKSTVATKTVSTTESERITYRIPDAPAGQPKEIIVEKTKSATTSETKKSDTTKEVKASSLRKNQISVQKELNAKTFNDKLEGWRVDYFRRLGETPFKLGVGGTSDGKISAGVSIEF